MVMNVSLLNILISNPCFLNTRKLASLFCSLLKDEVKQSCKLQVSYVSCILANH